MCLCIFKESELTVKGLDEPRHERRCLPDKCKQKDPDQPVDVKSLIRKFTKLHYVLKYPMLLLADSE